jgi:hypothetical protein
MNKKILISFFFIFFSLILLSFIATVCTSVSLKTKRDIEGLIGLNKGRGFMWDLKCKSLESWGSDCATVCCSGWEWNYDDGNNISNNIKDIFLLERNGPHGTQEEPAPFTLRYEPKLAKCLSENNFVVKGSSEDMKIHAPEVKDHADRVTLIDGVQHYSSKIKSLSHVFLRRTTVKKGGREFKKDFITMYFDFGCAPD